MLLIHWCPHRDWVPARFRQRTLVRLIRRESLRLYSPCDTGTNVTRTCTNDPNFRQLLQGFSARTRRKPTPRDGKTKCSQTHYRNFPKKKIIVTSCHKTCFFRKLYISEKFSCFWGSVVSYAERLCVWELSIPNLPMARQTARLSYQL